MVKCGACGKFLASADAAKCNKCVLWYHRQCAGLNLIGPIASPWHCPECKKNLVRDNRSETPVRGQTKEPLDEGVVNLMDTSPISITAPDATTELSNHFTSELRKFKEDFINTVRSEFQLLRNDLADLRSSLESTNDRMSSLEERVAIIENHKPVHAQVSPDIHNLIAQLRSDINVRDQELLATDIQISNLPEVTGENPVHTAMLVATKMGVNVEIRDIVSAERLGGRLIKATQPAPVESRPRFLVVRLARRDLRNELLEAARVRRGMTSADLGMPGPPARFYINERLTKQNRDLFRKAREAGGRLGWQFVWCKRGRILARNKPGDAIFQICCEADLQRVFELPPVSITDDGHMLS